MFDDDVEGDLDVKVSDVFQILNYDFENFCDYVEVNKLRKM